MKIIKNHHLFKFCIVCLLFTLLSSCDKGFIELNQDPNTNASALPKTLLAPALTSVVKTNLSLSEDINNELMQVHIDMGGTDATVFRYNLLSSLSVKPYNNWYIELINFKDIYRGATERLKFGSAENYNKTYMGIALICEVWTTSLITDAYGDVPYSEAGKVREQLFLPKFDAQKDIYEDLFKKLEEANQLLKVNTNLPADQIAADPLYNGVALNWRKFGNSLYLRLLLRTSAKVGLNSIAKIKEIVDTKPAEYPIIANNSESAILKWTGKAPYDSPFASSRDAQWGSLKISNFFIDNLKQWNDPRIAKWVTLYNGEYAGVPGGYAISENPEAKSERPTKLRTEPLLGNIINYSEVQFILAEAAVKGWINGSAKTYYENGVKNHIQLWGLTVPTNYFQTASVSFDNAVTLSDKMERIHLQKYYSLYFTDFQQWFENRRTGYPVLPKGNGLTNNGVMPSRLTYPIYLQSTNKANLDAAIARQGADDINTKVWWQAP